MTDAYGDGYNDSLPSNSEFRGIGGSRSSGHGRGRAHGSTAGATRRFEAARVSHESASELQGVSESIPLPESAYSSDGYGNFKELSKLVPQYVGSEAGGGNWIAPDDLGVSDEETNDLGDTLKDFSFRADMRSQQQELDDFMEIERQLQTGAVSPPTIPLLPAKADARQSTDSTVRQSFGDSDDWGTLRAPATSNGASTTAAAAHKQPSRYRGGRSGDSEPELPSTSDAGAPVSRLVSHMFHDDSKRQPASRRGRPPSQRGAPRDRSSRGSSRGSSRDRTSRGSQGSDEEYESMPPRALRAKMDELDEQIKKYKADRKQLDKRRATMLREMENRKRVFEEQKKAEMEKLEQERKEMELRMKRERKAKVRQSKSATLAATNLRKHREELDGMKATIAKMKVDEEQRAAKSKSTIERLKSQLKSARRKIDDLQEQVTRLEQERLEHWDDEEEEVAQPQPARTGRRGSTGKANARGGRAVRHAPRDWSTGDEEEDDGDLDVLHSQRYPDTTGRRRPAAGKSSVPSRKPPPVPREPSSERDEYSEDRGYEAAEYVDEFGIARRGSGPSSRHSGAAETPSWTSADSGSHGVDVTTGYDPRRYHAEGDEDEVDDHGHAGDRWNDGGDVSQHAPPAELHTQPHVSVADELTAPPGYGKTIASTNAFGEGKTETRYTDGTRVFTYRNNTTREITPEGHIIVRFHNGDVRKTDQDSGVEVYYFAEARTTHTSNPDGSQLYEFPNGQIETHYPDGSKQIQYADGTVKEVLVNGEMHSTFPDGTKLIEHPDGTKNILQGAGH